MKTKVLCNSFFAPHHLFYTSVSKWSVDEEKRKTDKKIKNYIFRDAFRLVGWPARVRPLGPARRFRRYECNRSDERLRFSSISLGKIVWTSVVIASPVRNAVTVSKPSMVEKYVEKRAVFLGGS